MTDFHYAFLLGNVWLAALFVVAAQNSPPRSNIRFPMAAISFICFAIALLEAK